MPTEIHAERHATRGVRDDRLGLRAALYFWLVVAAACAVTAPFLSHLTLQTPGWPTFLILGGAAAVAQLFVVVTPGNQSYHTTGMFLVAAALLLPPELVALMAVVQHVPDWLKRRLPFHIQTLQHRQLHAGGDGGVGGLAGDPRLAAARRRGDCGARRSRGLRGLRRREPHAARADAALRARPLVP